MLPGKITAVLVRDIRQEIWNQKQSPGTYQGASLRACRRGSVAEVVHQNTGALRGDVAAVGAGN